MYYAISITNTCKCLFVFNKKKFQVNKNTQVKIFEYFVWKVYKLVFEQKN